MISKDTATFQVLFIVSLFCAWSITTVKINSGVYLLKSLIRQVWTFNKRSINGHFQPIINVYLKRFLNVY